MKYIVIALLLILSFQTKAQIFWSKTYDFGIGKRNYVIDFVHHTDDIILVSNQFCEIPDGDLQVCSILSSIDNTGAIDGTFPIDTLATGLSEPLTISEDRLILSGHNYEPLLNRSTRLLGFNSNLTTESTNIITHAANHIYTNIGVEHIEGRYYTLGYETSADFSMAVGIIMAFEGDNMQWTYEYSIDNYNVEVNNIQMTDDGYLAFIAYCEPLSGSDDKPFYEIVKLSLEGKFVNSYSFQDVPLHENRLLVSSSGDYYFASRRNPLDYYDTSNGRLVKLGNDLESVQWVKEFPTDPISNGRSYSVHDIIESQDGAILVCGQVLDSSDSEGPGADINTTLNGFITKISNSGVQEWLRIYKHPNSKTNIDLTGKFKNSVLKKISEFPDGSIAAVGDVSYTLLQQFEIDENEQETYEGWVIRTDSEGCVTADCNEVIYIDQSVSTSRHQLTVRIFPNPTQDQLHIDSEISLDTFHIFDVIGRSVLSGDFLKRIDTSTLPAGTYFLHLFNDGQFVVQRSFTKAE